MAVDLFAEAGFQSVVAVGFCGGLRSEVSCGDLILPHAAVRGDGASKTYVPESYPAACSPTALAAALRCAAEGDQQLKTGVIWSTDGILRETRDQVERWHDAGCLGVDMETSALYTVASVHGINAVAILVASDNVFECKHTDLNYLRRGWQAATGLAVAICTDLASGS